MQVTIHSDGGSSGTLCPYNGSGYALLESPSKRQFGGQREVQVAPLFRAASKKVFGRGNLSHNVAFSVFREHGGVDAAEQFQVFHASEVVFNELAAHGGYVRLASDSGASGWALLDAQFSDISVSLKGRTTTTSYSVVCASTSAC